MKKTEIGKDGAPTAINDGRLEHVVGGVDNDTSGGNGFGNINRYCENCRALTPHTPTAKGSYCCNVCGYDPAKKSGN